MLSDTRAAYESIVAEHPTLNWLLLYYPPQIAGTSQEQLQLLTSGGSGLAEMKHNMTEHGLDQVYVAFYRELEDESRKRRCILVNYLPVGLSGVRRARIMVHSRRLLSSMPAIQSTLTVDHISNLTSSAIQKALSDPESAHIITLDSVSDDPVPEDPSVHQSQIPLPTSAVHSYASSLRRTPTSASPEPVSRMLSSLLRRKGKLPSPPQSEEPVMVDKFGTEDEDEISEHSLPPPPPPPKDEDSTPPPPPPPRPLPSSSQHSQSASLDRSRRRPVPTLSALPSQQDRRSHSISEFAVIARKADGSGELTVHDDPHYYNSEGSADIPIAPRPIAKSYTLPSEPLSNRRSNFVIPLTGKWSPNPVLSSASMRSPEDRAKIRVQIKAEREMKEKLAVQEEEKRKAELKRMKEEMAEEAAREEMRRKREVEAEVRRATSLRRQKEEKERREEEEKREEMKMKKEAERRKREEEHRRLEAWRRERAEEASSVQKREEEERRLAVMTRKKLVDEAVVRLKSDIKRRDQAALDTQWYSGDISIQTLSGDTLIWRRRHWRIDGQVMALYRSAKDTNLILQSIDLLKDVRAVKEWDQGYEDLKAIPHSFVLEFKDRLKESWSLYADSEEEKVKVLALLNYIGRL